MKHILEAQVLNKYRSHVPLHFYNLLRGHTGVDLNYYFEELPSPVSGKIVLITKQPEMGNCIYLEDLELGNIHVFSHMDKIAVKVGNTIQRGQILGRTGNTGSKSTSPHLHYESITFRKPNGKAPSIYDSLYNPIMVRTLANFQGFNISPLDYLRKLYGKYRLNSSGEIINE